MCTLIQPHKCYAPELVSAYVRTYIALHYNYKTPLLQSDILGRHNCPSRLLGQPHFTQLTLSTAGISLQGCCTHTSKWRAWTGGGVGIPVAMLHTVIDHTAEGNAADSTADSTDHHHMEHFHTHSQPTSPYSHLPTYTPSLLIHTTPLTHTHFIHPHPLTHNPLTYTRLLLQFPLQIDS